MDALALTRNREPVTTDRLLKAFFEGRSPHTLRAYEYDLQDFARFLHRTLGLPSRTSVALQAFLLQGAGSANELVLNYRSELSGRCAPTTVNRRIATIKSLVKFGRMIGAVTWTIEVRGVRMETSRDTRGPTIDQAIRLLEHVAQTPGKKGRRNYAMFRLLLDLGLRCSEVVGLNLADFGEERGEIHVRGKGMKIAKLPLTLPPQTRAALDAWVAIRGREDGPLFTRFYVHQGKRPNGGRLVSRSLWKLVRVMGREVGLRIWPHALRHTAITTAVAQADAHGIGLDQVRTFSRHKHIETLLIYRDQFENKQGEIATLVAAKLTPTSAKGRDDHRATDGDNRRGEPRDDG